MGESIMSALAGGALIGLAVSLMLLVNGRVTGISGISSGVVCRDRTDRRWRQAFVLGLLAGGVCLRLVSPAVFADSASRGWPTVLAAGFLVGFGTMMGSGCTSGHGVCGLSRLSVRSLVATLVFMVTGILAVFVFRSMLGGGQ